MTIATDSDALERWASSVRVNPAALRGIGDERRRARELVTSLSSIVDAAMLRARQADATGDPFRAAMIVALVTRVRTDNADLFARLEAGDPVSSEAYNLLWRELLTVTSNMGEALAVDELAQRERLPVDDADRATVNEPIPGGVPTRLRGGRRRSSSAEDAGAPAASRAPATPSPAAESGAGIFLGLLIFGGLAGLAVARGRA